MKETIKFIRKNLRKTAELYPIHGSNAQKAKYLMDLIHSTADIRKAINECGITWPTNGASGNCDELQDLKKVIGTENDNIKAANETIKSEILLLNKEKDNINL
jgi:hypothetical protein